MPMCWISPPPPTLDAYRCRLEPHKAAVWQWSSNVLLSLKQGGVSASFHFADRNDKRRPAEKGVCVGQALVKGREIRLLVYWITNAPFHTHTSFLPLHMFTNHLRLLNVVFLLFRFAAQLVTRKNRAVKWLNSCFLVDICEFDVICSCSRAVWQRDQCTPL